MLWANLGADKREQRKRQFKSTLLMLALSLFGTAVIATTIYFNREGTAIRQELDPALERSTEDFHWAGRLLISLLVHLAFTLLVTFGNVIIFTTVPPLAVNYERHHTHAQLELHVALKCTFFQVFNTLLSSATFFFEAAFAGKQRQWYAMGGSLIVNTLFSDFIFIQVVMDWVRIQDLVSKHLLARFASSQHEMNRRHVAPAGIYLRLQNAAGRQIRDSRANVRLRDSNTLCDRCIILLAWYVDRPLEFITPARSSATYRRIAHACRRAVHLPYWYRTARDHGPHLLCAVDFIE